MRNRKRHVERVVGMIIVQAVAGLLLGGAFALAQDGPRTALDVPLLPGAVVRVYDGDTLSAVDVELWPGLHVRSSIRLRGVDTPELRGAKCEEERTLGYRARDFVRERVAAADGWVLISRPEHGLYAGRVVADVTAHGRSLADDLIAAGLGRPYDGRGARLPWCEPEHDADPAVEPIRAAP